MKEGRAKGTRGKKCEDNLFGTTRIEQKKRNRIVGAAANTLPQPQNTMTDYAKFEEIDLTVEEVLHCSFSKWAPLFPKNVFPYKIIAPLPDGFIDYVQSDGIKLPSAKTNKIVLEQNSDNEYSDWEDVEDIENDTGEVEEMHSEFQKNHEEKEVLEASGHFPQLNQEITQSIAELGGKVIPKLNWSSPKDASWLMPGNVIKCTEVDDVLLLLKSSDHVIDDLAYPFLEVSQLPEDETRKNGQDRIKVDYELVLKQWRDLNPALEFRVFVKEGKILGISQRDLNHYDFLKELEPQLKENIQLFVTDKVVNKLNASLPNLTKFIVDVYVPRPFDKIYIIDINPFLRKSDSLLFTWNELLTADPDGDTVPFRLINETNVGAFAKKQYSESQVPLDVIGAAQDHEALIELAKEWEKLQSKEAEEEDEAVVVDGAIAEK